MKSKKCRNLKELNKKLKLKVKQKNQLIEGLTERIKEGKIYSDHLSDEVYFWRNFLFDEGYEIRSTAEEFDKRREIYEHEEFEEIEDPEEDKRHLLIGPSNEGTPGSSTAELPFAEHRFKYGWFCHKPKKTVSCLLSSEWTKTFALKPYYSVNKVRSSANSIDPDSSGVFRTRTRMFEWQCERCKILKEFMETENPYDLSNEKVRELIDGLDLETRNLFHRRDFSHLFWKYRSSDNSGQSSDADAEVQLDSSRPDIDQKAANSEENFFTTVETQTDNILAKLKRDSGIDVWSNKTSQEWDLENPMTSYDEPSLISEEKCPIENDSHNGCELVRENVMVKIYADAENIKTETIDLIPTIEKFSSSKIEIPLKTVCVDENNQEIESSITKFTTERGSRLKAWSIKYFCCFKKLS